MKGIAAGLVVILFFTLSGSHLYGDKIDLVKLQKSEKKRRKSDQKKKSKLIITNDNINKLKFKNPRYTIIQMVAETDGPPSKTTPQMEKAPDRRRTKEYWQHEKIKLSTKIAELKKKINDDQLKLNLVQSEHFRMDLPLQKAKLKTKIDLLTESLTLDKNRIKYLKVQLDALHEKARKAGVPPGWLR